MRRMGKVLFVSVLVVVWIFGISLDAYAIKIGKKKSEEQKKPEVKQVDCLKDKPPEIVGVHFFLGERELEEPVILLPDEVPAFKVAISYKDADCNLTGGEVFGRFDAQQWSLVGVIDEAYCSSDESGHLIYIPMPEETGLGRQLYQLRLIDNCDKESKVFTFSFVVRKQRKQPLREKVSGQTKPEGKPAPEAKGKGKGKKEGKPEGKSEQKQEKKNAGKSKQPEKKQENKKGGGDKGDKKGEEGKSNKK